MTDSELADYVRDHSCWRADAAVTVADWDRGVLAIEAEARAAALDEAERVCVQAFSGSGSYNRTAIWQFIHRAIDALREDER